MKHLFVSLALLVSVSFSGCLKKGSCNLKTPAEELPSMQAYATANGMTATQHSSGILYEIISPGSGAAITLSNRISVTYTGKLLNGSVFDSSPTPTQFYPLTGFITGWQVGVPLIKKGGSIKLLIPSAYAYGCDGAGTIPGNSVLYFEITVSDVQ